MSPPFTNRPRPPTPPRCAQPPPACLDDAVPAGFAQPHRFVHPTSVVSRLADTLPIPTAARLRLLDLDDTLSRLEISHCVRTQHQLID